MQKESIAYGAFIILVVAVAAKLASFLAEAILAAYLGTSAVGDAFYMVTGIQQVLYPMLSVGIWKVFLPEYKKTMTRDDGEKADELGNKVLFAFTVLAIIFSFLLALFAGQAVAVMAPGFNPETSMLCTKLVMVTSPMYIFIIVSSVYATMLQCRNKFFASQIREISTHIPLILAALFFYDVFGVWALAVGLVIGGLFRLLVELPFINWGYKYKLDYKINTPEMLKMGKQMPSALLASGADQITILVNKIIASMQAVGTVSALNYASKLQNVFIGLFSSAVITASYPRIAAYVGEHNESALVDLLNRIICVVVAFLVPISFGSLILGKDLVVVLFERGAFDASASAVTAEAFACYATGLVFAALFVLFNNLFYAYELSGKAMLASVISMGSNIVLCIAFSGMFGAAGLALSASLSYLIATAWQAVTLMNFLKMPWKSIAGEFLKVAVASLASLMAAFGVLVVMGLNTSLNRLVVGVVVFCAVYFALIVIMRTETAQMFRGKLLSILGNRA